MVVRFFAFVALAVSSMSPAQSQIVGKYFDTEYVKDAKTAREACEHGSDTIVDFGTKSVVFHESACKVHRIEKWPSSNDAFDYYVTCPRQKRSRLIVTRTGDGIWIQWDDGSARSKTAGVTYRKCPVENRDERAATSTAGKPSSAVLNRLGQCSKTTIVKITDRFGRPLAEKGSQGTIVVFANGLFQTSYDTETAIARSQLGDSVNVCLKAKPAGCPPGDDRGKIYTTQNLRTGEAWTLQDDQHSCGGA